MIRDIAWTPRKVKALREVQHLSQRAFAEHLGFAQSTVANWEKAGRESALHHETLEVLNRELEGLPDDLRDRFDRQLGVAPGKLGAGSTVRTQKLLESLSNDADSPLPYHPPTDVVKNVRTFLASSTRVFLLAGAPGTGKSRLTHHIAQQLADQTDIQLLTVASWDLAGVDVAVEILRYASIPRGHDALLTLEGHCAQLSHPCTVVIDGISSHDEFAVIGRQVDAILRQVTTSSLRFLLTVRTPPSIETTAHPLLHAALFISPEAPRGDPATELTAWTPAEARSLWDQVRVPEAPPFDRLPSGIQQLVRVPIYMRLALSASLKASGHDLNAYALLDHCVRAIVGEGTTNTDLVLASLTDLAHRQSQVPTSLAMAPLPADHTSSPHPPVGVANAIVRDSAHGRIEFTHDVLREFFLSTRIADLLHAQGRSVMAIGAVNDLAAQASTSSAARSIIELVFQRLDNLAPDLLEYLATAPTASTNSTVPLLMALADGSRFATPQVLRALAKRAEQEASIRLSRALLASGAVHAALGHGRTRWLLALLRRFGTALWPEITGFIERTFDVADAYTLLDAADLANGDEAIFFARHFYLFFADTANNALEAFLGHPSWRVRAALAEGTDDDRAPIDTAGLAVMERLVHDADYKVRAAVAPVITRAPDAVAAQYIATLLHDDNWHVRERTLRGLDRFGPDHPRRDLVRSALAAMNTDPGWRHCPRHIRPSWERLQILHLPDRHPDVMAGDNHDRDDHGALLTVLREARTGQLVLSPPLRQAVVARAQRSSSWLVRQEAARTGAESHSAGNEDDPRLSRERFRRARGQRAVQIALDLRDINDAITVARAAVAAGADFIEIGDPLIKEVGVRAIEQIKAAVPEATIVAEMMSADWGRDQVLLAAQSGADIVLLIGPATTASVSAAAEAGQRLGVPILLDAPTATTHRWVIDMERAGVDGFTITTNIDLGIGSTTALDAARTLRSWTQLPVAVSGGYSTTDHAIFASPDWDILIIGRSIADAVDPASAANHIVELAHRTERHP
ncbi:orotidine 5'-phosphate decarboxylase / HUMPS family protein [Amycolatopsis palatopharyngis]|uniref:orotidine 5'-phosphate decarboxylase / HUMPS family protein n=1 Tax=Amycolatopsis palatopharyngis TaxID=187982 RepID=UPI000E235A4A|nr:orotidine 5'-phosphate decarboxylase / HUMPS family protein [Amycolatopsis palatopharyngis]